MVNPAEVWKAQKHSFDVWPDVLRHAAARTPMAEIHTPDLERMKWYGFFYRKRDAPGRYMNRIRITANELTAEQAREIAAIAYEHGHGIVDVTTRANLQVQGLGIEHLPKVAERLAAVGLTAKQTGHDNVRNVFAHPFSGVLPDELIDTRQLCRDVTALFVDSREYSDLPRKFNLCLNGAAEHSVHFWTQDLSFLARRVGRQVLFQVLVGGTQGQNPHLAWHLPVLVRPDQVVAVTAALLDLFRLEGSREKRHRARLRYLVERIGIEAIGAFLGDRVALRAWPDLPPPVPAGRNDDLVGWFPERRPDRWTMGLAVPLGRLSWRQLEALAVLARRWGGGELRTTHEQGIAVLGVPTGFRDAAATDAAAVGLSVHADTLVRNTMACTGTQFCNIAVTETKGAMFRLIETLRQRALALHGIRIHMSGCPSSCAQHFTADIGLKGVRVRRLVGTREGFDVYLGGGVAGDVHLGLRYRLGVDAEQLPLLIEEVVGDYYLRHREGETFSAYWRAKLREAEAAKVGEGDYRPSTWICERCEHRHLGEDPPVFCPGCAGVRRLFARVEDDASAPAAARRELPAREEQAARPRHSSPGSAVGNARLEPNGKPPAEPPRDDGYVLVAQEPALREDAGTAVEIGGHAYALFRIGGKVAAIDGLCPHEGGPLAEGTVRNGVVTCPWHGWTFDACSGCSVDPPGNDVARYPTLVEGGGVYVRPEAESARASAGAAPARAVSGSGPRLTPRRTPPLPATAELTVAEVREEAPDVRAFRLDNG
ncbi:MAG: Rieske 2Fe-2S domain-containing protein [Acidobacteria bacterium]|nr:Rieske 2Fe-2S domain-containing protein [Acidobacteriota bacterium]